MTTYGLIRTADPDFLRRLREGGHPQIGFAGPAGTVNNVPIPYHAFVRFDGMTCADRDTIDGWLADAGAHAWDLVMVEHQGTKAPRIKHPDGARSASAVVLVQSGDPQALVTCAERIGRTATREPDVWGAATVRTCSGNPAFNVILVIWAASPSDLPGVLGNVKDCEPGARYLPLLYMARDGSAHARVEAVEISFHIEATVAIDPDDEG
jgi:hypothetical protein